MLHIGCHLSSSKGFLAMGKTALSIGAGKSEATRKYPTRNKNYYARNQKSQGGDAQSRMNTTE